MKSNILIILILCFVQCLQSQNQTAYDNAMISLANNVAKQAKQKSKLKVAVWNFTDTYGKETELSKYLTEDFEIHFTNSEGLQVVNRHNLKKQYLAEHKLTADGFIDPNTAKKMGMISAADAIITGTVDAGLHTIRVRVKTINTETGFQIAATAKNIPIDENIRYILPTTDKINRQENRDKNKSRVNTTEKYNNPKSTNKRCESLNIGDFCFTNYTNKDILIDIRQRNTRLKHSITISAGANECLNDLPVATYQYSLYKSGIRILMQNIDGSFRVEKCKSINKKIK